MANKRNEIHGALNSLFSGNKPKEEKAEQQQPIEEKEAARAEAVTDQNEQQQNLKEEEPQLQPQQRKRGRPKKNEERIAAGYARTSLVIRKDIYAKVCSIASKEELANRDIVEGALTLFIQKYEAKNGAVSVDREKKDVMSLL